VDGGVRYRHPTDGAGPPGLDVEDEVEVGAVPSTAVVPLVVEKAAEHDTEGFGLTLRARDVAVAAVGETQRGVEQLTEFGVEVTVDGSPAVEQARHVQL